MSSHEKFKELSALAAIGLLSSNEDRELNKHLRECEICREVHDDYSRLVQHQLPQADAIRWRMKLSIPKRAPDAELRDRFLARARAEGADLSAAAERPSYLHHSSPSSSRWTCRWRPALALGVLATATFLGTWALRRNQSVPRSGTLDAVAQKAHENENLQGQLAALRQTAELESVQLVRMRKENSLSEKSLKRFQRQLQETQARVETLSTELKVANSENTQLAGADKQQDTVIADLRIQIDKLDSQRGDNLSQLVGQQERIRELTASLEEEKTNLERERQLMAVSNDVRQLIGARNLHIIDVRDVNGDSRSAKAFGRVLYAKGQSLIFYAFDLPNGGLSPAKYTFQAWGQREVESQLPRNLGTFQVDDHEQHRWVLKVNNPTLLAGIDSVFVTAESHGDAKGPRGKKLLYAYIAGQPNHP
jgi:hypothetical protein